MKKYTIKKGQHYSKPRRFGLYLNQKKVSFKFIFDNSCFFSIGSNIEYLDVNKLVGFSFLHHMDNSMRVGWRPNPTLLNQIDLFFFFHQEGKISFKYFTTVKCDTVYQIDIENDFKNNAVFFTLKGEDGFVIIRQSGKYVYPLIRLGYTLNYYFGGTLSSPQDMSAEIERV